ncbi:MAG: glycosyltransferase family 2 protein [Winogradskyella sp.]|nr:glycosyltransferase family 2 protein [Winogradskyella sp.]
MFSVVIPLYNKELSIKKTIHSVLDQSFEDFEILVVNDGSTDKSLEIVKGIQDDRIKIIDQQNAGVSSARNRGIKEAKFDWIALLDADDLWETNKLEKQSMLLINNPDLFWCFAAYKIKKSDRYKVIDYKNVEIIDDAIDAIAKGAVIQTSSVVINKSVFKDEKLLFSTKYNNSEDREVWYKLACLYPRVGYINKPLSSYVIFVSSSLTSVANENKEMPFLSMKNRMKETANLISQDRAEKLFRFIDAFNKKAILSKWVYSAPKVFKNIPLNMHFNSAQVFLLNNSVNFPFIFKRIIFEGIMVSQSLFNYIGNFSDKNWKHDV